MKLRANLVMAVAALAAPGAPAALAQPPQASDCEDTLFQAQVNRCAEATYTAASKEMMAVYEQALGQYREQDREIAEEEPRYAGAEMLLRESQTAWTTSRDDFCSARTLSAQGGTMGVGVRYSCLATLTRNRTEELRSVLD